MIKHLYINGDSMSFGTDLDTSNQKHYYDFTDKMRDCCYGGILAEKLNLNHINKSLPGGSNQRIYRKTVYNLTKQLSKYNMSNTFVLIGLTSFLRNEFYVKQTDNWYPFLPTVTPIDTMQKRFADCFIPTMDEKGSQISDFLNVLGTQNFLIKNKIPYLLFNAIPTFFSNGKNYIPQFTKKQIYEKRYYNTIDFNSFSLINNYPLGVTSHPLEEAHAAWAELLFEYIINNQLLDNRDLYEL